MIFPIFVRIDSRILSFDSSHSPSTLSSAVGQQLCISSENLYITTTLGKNLAAFSNWKDILGYEPEHLTLNANFRLRGGGGVVSFCRNYCTKDTTNFGQTWNEDSEWVDEDEILIKIVERRRRMSKLNYDEIVMKWREEEWTSIRNELARKTSKKRHPWKEVKLRFKKVIVKKYDADNPITKEDMQKLRERNKETLKPIIERVLKKRMSELTISDLPKMEEDQIISAQGIYASGRFDTRYGIEEAEWEALDENFQNSVGSIRDICWSYAHILKSEYPQGSLMRNFWTSGTVRKELLIKFSLLYYSHFKGGTITPELIEFLDKMKTF